MFVNTICIRANGIMNNNENRPNILELINLDIQEDFSKRHDQLFQATDWSDEIGDFFNYNPLYDEEFSYKDRIVISHESFINRIRLT